MTICKFFPCISFQHSQSFSDLCVCVCATTLSSLFSSVFVLGFCSVQFVVCAFTCMHVLYYISLVYRFSFGSFILTSPGLSHSFFSRFLLEFLFVFFSPFICVIRWKVFPVCALWLFMVKFLLTNFLLLLLLLLLLLMLKCVGFGMVTSRREACVNVDNGKKKRKKGWIK